MSDAKLMVYQRMWTADVGSYCLVQGLPSGSPLTAAIVDSETGAPLVIDEATELVEELIALMRNAGARVISFDEYQRWGRT